MELTCSEQLFVCNLIMQDQVTYYFCCNHCRGNQSRYPVGWKKVCNKRQHFIRSYQFRRPCWAAGGCLKDRCTVFWIGSWRDWYELHECGINHRKTPKSNHWASITLAWWSNEYRTEVFAVSRIRWKWHNMLHLLLWLLLTWWICFSDLHLFLDQNIYFEFAPLASVIVFVQLNQWR